ncbi:MULTISPECIES: protein translocase subunit SecD [unclassified Sphingomonas]|uniref:protein translocase subunit SecD n=1 Tax=unclassified Sphingomonas TaxID=196159 RepID=UPI0006F46A36|nr:MULTISPECIES: protein translocase subunit SecD [unclassified Sphingomonas]KQM98820.1 preprotein translocase subunit SecD [Sphingomonas sp. Leaf25]KQN40513.1 preprotein translocase subunit SecD [Sphingomonas sp. Leaf42]KQT29867.1 preprotein translocase subunit SecD [Sphingomonas sp. Leaf407]
MLDFPRWKRIAIWASVILLSLFAVPSLLPEATRAKLPGWVPAPTINLGLDLAGGSYILLEAKTEDVAGTRIEAMREMIATEMRRAPRVSVGDISTRNGQISFMVRDASQVDAAREKLLGLTGGGAGMTGQREWDIEVRDTTRFVLTPTQAGLRLAVENAMKDATEVVRRRIDALGTREPTIIQQGSNRIVVQVPGLSDPKALKDLLGKTARLEFKLVDQAADPAAVAQGRAPAGSQVLPYAGAGAPIAVKRTTIISGSEVADARQSYDQNGQPNVTINFNAEGGRRFARVTQENVGKPFAIIVDNQVISAPNINEAILGGSASISGGFTVDGANQLAIALRSGKLPVDLTVVQESTVSPELGADSIKAGVTAAIIATIAVIAFMVMTYGRFGIYSTIAVVLNILMILAVMAFLNATLTLPGIAGFVLTIGTAVDANVLINERIREERRRGRSVLQSLELGYKEASRTIFEANVTHAIAGGIMLILGSGPIRGFAVVLLLGIASSVFTAVTFTRMLVAGWMRRHRPTDITI